MNRRIRTLFTTFLLLITAIVVKLFYWQIVSAGDLERQATEQHTTLHTISTRRGEIITADNFPLVFNEPRYALTVYTPNIEDDPVEIVDKILPLIEFEIDDPEIATDEAKREKELERLAKETRADILEKLTTRTWALLYNNLSIEQKETIEDFGILGLDFEEFLTRHYPEASMSAHLTGFVGKNDIGSATGYFGIEGYYNRELKGVEGVLKQEKDAFGIPLLTDSFRQLSGRDGRDLKLYLDRGIQFIAEKELKDALELYGASSGEVLIMDPKTGGILALAAEPSYEPQKYWKYETSLYKNPVISNTYEPGSTFKVLVMAAALEEKAVDRDDKCDICSEPFQIGKYTIKTWDGNYVENRTPEEIIVNSDNIGMVWTSLKLGGNKFENYIKEFGFGEKTGIDLQEEVSAPLRKNWGDIDHATASFGQGIAVTSIQMLSAVGALANEGNLMEPHVVQEVRGEKIQAIEPKIIRKVVSEETAQKITNMMVAAVEAGESKWTRIKNYRVAGKTGTSQIAVAGHYDTEKTIASFVGFAPADNPAFVMLVKLREPTSSPWGSETAAPLWFSIAKKLLINLNIPPSY